MRFLPLLALLAVFSCSQPAPVPPPPRVLVVNAPEARTDDLRAPEDRRKEQIHDPVVQLQFLDDDGEVVGQGSGFVFAVQEVDGVSVSFILTAEHVVDAPIDPFTCEPYDLEINFFPARAPGRIEYVDDTLDFAVVSSEHGHTSVARVREGLHPRLFQKIYAAGVGAVDIRLCNPGEVTGFDGDDFFMSAPVNWGYSGGAAMAEFGGNWYAVGVINVMGRVHDSDGHPYPAYHCAGVLSMTAILDKLAEGLDVNISR